MTKIYPKDKFSFLNIDTDNSKNDPKENDCYFVKEWRMLNSFPFLKTNIIICYKLINNEWVEQDLTEIQWNTLKT